MAVEDPLIMEYRHIKDLKDFIYESATIQLDDPKNKYIDQVSLKRFQNLDLVILTGTGCAGSEGLLPCWDFSYHQAQTLVRMCIQQGKALVGLGLGASLIRLYYSTRGLPCNYKYTLIDSIKDYKNQK